MTAFGAHRLPPLPARLLALAQKMPVSWTGRRAALALRKLALLKRPAIVDATVDGMKLRLYTQDNVSERKFLFMPQFFDPFERALLKDTFKSGGTFVDIGANAGIYTLTAASAGASKILAIEPNPKVLERLAFNANLNGYTAIVTEQSGVSDVAGAFDLVLDDSNLGGSSLVAARGGNSISVPCLPLLDILKKHNIAAIDALKIDIEGAEDKALVPFLAAAPIPLRPRFLILENSESQWTRDLNGALAGAGYAILRRTRMNTVWALKAPQAKSI